MTQHAGAKGFGQRLAQERRLLGVREGRDIQRQDMAKAMRVSNSTYGRWEDGTIPSDDAMERLARYFGVTPGWLHYGQEPREAVTLVEEDAPPLNVKHVDPAKVQPDPIRNAAKRRRAK